MTGDQDLLYGAGDSLLLIPGDEGGLVDGVPGDAVGLGVGGAVVVFRLNVEDAIALGGNFQGDIAVGGGDGVEAAGEDAAALGRSPNPQGGRFLEEHPFTGRHSRRGTDDGDQRAEAGFFHLDAVGEHIEGPSGKELSLGIGDRLGRGIVNLGFEDDHRFEVVNVGISGQCLSGSGGCANPHAHHIWQW